MSQRVLYGRCLVALSVVVAVMLALPASVAGQTVNGQARAVNASVASLFGTTTITLADTGTLAGPGDARDATSASGSVPGLLRAEVLRAVTMSWPDQVVSQASLSNIGLRVGMTSITADVVMADAVAMLSACFGAGCASGVSFIGNLQINGVPITVTGAPNQTVAIAGGRVILNEQTISPVGVTVNALHIIVGGVADVTLATATAGIR